MEQNNKEIIKAIKNIHRALILGVLFFLAVAIYINSSVGAMSDDDSMNTTLLIAFNIISIIVIFAGVKSFGNKMKGVANYSISERLVKYRESFIIRSATIEAPAFFFIIGYLLSGAIEFALEGAICLLILSFYYPTNKRLSEELNHDITEFI